MVRYFTVLYFGKSLILAGTRRNRHRRVTRQRNPLHRTVRHLSLPHKTHAYPNSTPSSGSNFVQGSLNWGPAYNLNGISKSYSWWTERRRSFADDFRTYVLEWTEDFLRIYVDTRLHTLLDMRFNKPFFQRGEFPPVVFNGSDLVALQNPWINGTDATPFDQGTPSDPLRALGYTSDIAAEFYLILDVAVGSTNGWFPEGQGNKPWLDRSESMYSYPLVMACP